MKILMLIFSSLFLYLVIGRIVAIFLMEHDYVEYNYLDEESIKTLIIIFWPIAIIWQLIVWISNIICDLLNI